MRFHLVFYNTKSTDKHSAERRHEYLGNREAIWTLWHTLTTAGNRHVEVFNLAGEKQCSENGAMALDDFVV